MKITFKVDGKHIPQIGITKTGTHVTVSESVGNSLIRQGLADKYKSSKSTKKGGEK